MANLGSLPENLAQLERSATAAYSTGLETIQSLAASSESPDQAEQLKAATTKLAATQKEWGTALNKFSKELERRIPSTPLPSLFPSPPVPAPPLHLHPALAALSPPPPPTPNTPFSAPVAIASLNETIALHLARLGVFDTLDVFLKESATPALDSTLLDSLRKLHEILEELKMGVCKKALQWVAENEVAMLEDTERELEFQLRKEEFIRILLQDSDLTGSTEPLLPQSILPSDQAQAALAYGGIYFRRLVTPARQATICSLLTSPLYMPFSRLLASPYASIYQEYATPTVGRVGAVELRLQSIFSAAFLKSVKLPVESPLSVVTDIGSGGAIAMIQKVRAVMKEKRTEWSAVAELPVEIPLPAQHRYHSVFACPVSKEQSTATNPPMLLPCGHVIAKESLTRLARGSPTLKCPYCPVVSHLSAAVRVNF